MKTLPAFLVHLPSGHAQAWHSPGSVELHDFMPQRVEVVGIVTRIEPALLRFGDLCSSFHPVRPITAEALIARRKIIYPPAKEFIGVP